MARTPTPQRARMAKHRLKRQLAGDRQVTAYLSREAADLLQQMVAFSGDSKGELLSSAIIMLSLDYSYWNVLDDEDSHEQNWHGESVENPHFGQSKVPPWIVEEERRSAAMRKEIATEMFTPAKLRDGLEVYTRGIANVTGDKKNRK